MILTVSKRVEFSASRRLFSPKFSAEENRKVFGEESAAPYGTGRNYVAYFVFSGQPDATTGMLINISEIKERAGEIVHDRYDHRFLNEDNPAFRDKMPTAEFCRNFLMSRPLLGGEPARLVRALRELRNGSQPPTLMARVTSNYCSISPRTPNASRTSASEHENSSSFPPPNTATLWARFPFASTRRSTGPALGTQEKSRLIRSLRNQLDHNNSPAIATIALKAVTTESLSRIIRQADPRQLPYPDSPARNDDFLRKVSDGGMFLGIANLSAHRWLHCLLFRYQNATVGKCTTPRHGHRDVARRHLAANTTSVWARWRILGLRNALGQLSTLARQTPDLKPTNFATSRPRGILCCALAESRQRASTAPLRLRYGNAHNRFTLRMV